MDIVKKIDSLLTRFIFIFTNILVFSMSILVVMQIVFRISGTPLTWSEEVARLLMVWLIFMGAAYLYNMPKNGHIIVDALLTVLPPKWVDIIKKITEPLITIFIMAVLYYGCILLQQSYTVVLPATKLSLIWIYLSVPVSMAFMLFFSLAKFLYIIEKKRLTIN